MKTIDMSLPKIDRPDPSSRALLFRAEGQPFWTAARSGVSYARKYFYKKPLSSPDLMEHFEKAAREWAREERPSSLSSDGGVRLAFVGDIMWMKNQWESFLDENLRRHLDSFDLLFGNLESPISSLHPVPHRLPDYPTYNSSPDLIRSFRSERGGSLWSALSFANNHTLDRGDEGAIETLNFLERERIPFSGVGRPEGNDSLYVPLERKGIRFGFYATSWGLNDMSQLGSTRLRIEVVPGLAPLEPAKIDLSRVEGVLRQMDKDGVEFKIVSLHWGYEFESYPDPAVMEAARRIIAAGADLIIGSHPHVQQPYEICHVNPTGADGARACVVRTPDGKPRRGLVAYSMGNFATAMITSSCRVGTIESIDVFRDGKGAVHWRHPKTSFVWNRFKPSRKLVLVPDGRQYLERQDDRDVLVPLEKTDRETIRNIRSLLGSP